MDKRRYGRAKHQVLVVSNPGSRKEAGRGDHTSEDHPRRVKNSATVCEHSGIKRYVSRPRVVLQPPIRDLEMVRTK